MDWWFGPDYTGQRPDLDGDRCPPNPEAVLQLRTTAGSRWRSRRAGPTSASRTSSATTGSSPRSSASTSRSTSRWTGSATPRCRSRASGTWTCCTRTRRTSTPRTSPTRSGSSPATRAATSRSRPQIEVQMGHGWAPAVTALEHDVPIGLSSDVATTAPSDQFTQMRSIFGSERGRKHQEAWDANLDGLEASPGLITVAPGPLVGDHRWGPGRRDRGPDRLADTGQAGRHRHHRRVGRERGADHRPGRGGRLRRGRLERQDGHRGRRDRSRRTSGSRPRSTRRARPSRRRATTCSRSSATRSRAGSSRADARRRLLPRDHGRLPERPWSPNA